MNDTTFSGNGKVSFIPVITNTNQKPQTNADRIRAMTDEELAEWIETHSCPVSACNELLEGYFVDCHNCWLSWLKSPVEVDDGT